MRRVALPLALALALLVVPAAYAAVQVVGSAMLVEQNASGVNGMAGFAVNGWPGLGVRIKVMGLEPGTSHAAHIHDGSCSGPILFPLTNVVADANGAGTSDTTGIPIPTTTPNWWVNVHQDATGGLSISCGQAMRR